MRRDRAAYNRLRLWWHRLSVKYVNGGLSSKLFTYTVEDLVLDDFLQDPVAHCAELEAFLKQRGDFRCVGNEVWLSRSNRIVVTFDAIGTSVMIDCGPLIDLVPEWYGITRDQAYDLHDAVAGHIPGTLQNTINQQKATNGKVRNVVLT